MIGCIYQLKIRGRIVYIGSTTKPIIVRLRNHIACSKNGTRGLLYDYLRGFKSKPSIELLEEVECKSTYELEIAEAKWISIKKNEGLKLLNTITPSGKVRKDSKKYYGADMSIKINAKQYRRLKLLAAKMDVSLLHLSSDIIEKALNKIDRKEFKKSGLPF